MLGVVLQQMGVPHGGSCQCTLLGYTWICTMSTPQQVLTGARWGVVQKKMQVSLDTWELPGSLPDPGWGVRHLCLRGAASLAFRWSNPKSAPGGRDAPARLRGLDQASTQLESWCPGSPVISYVVLSSHRASLHSVPHSHNKGLHGPHSPLPLPSEASTFIILFTEVEAEAQRGSWDCLGSQDGIWGAGWQRMWI